MPSTNSIDRVVSLALRPWALTRPMVSMVATILARRLTGASAADDFIKRPAAESTRSAGVMVIPLHGVLAPRMNALSEFSGGTTFDLAGQHLAAAMADREVGTIVLDWDSPGGSVAGAGEFAKQILDARQTKRIISHANFEMCSAAYWAGACASEVVAAPSALVGSIGVLSIHEDLSRRLAEHGMKVTYISAGKYKVDGNETEPLSDTARARMQAIVDKYYRDFVGAVALGRGTTAEAVRGSFGEGSVCTADEALAMGMVDRIATLDKTIAYALAPSPTTVAYAAERARTLNAITLLALAG